VDDLETTVVINPAIPLDDMTLLERLVLSHIFDAGEIDGCLHLYSDRGAASVLHIPAIDLEAAYAASRNVSVSGISPIIARRLNGSVEPTGTIDVTLSDRSWEFILRDIVARSSDLTEIRALEWYRHASQSPDSFGVKIILITADAIVGRNSDELLEDMRDEAGTSRLVKQVRRSPGGDGPQAPVDVGGPGVAPITYRVSWDIDINDAASPLDAARKARAIVRRHASAGIAYNVEAPDGIITVVDLQEVDAPPLGKHSSVLWQALVGAERFIAGFEGDELQEGLDPLLADVPAALRGRTDRQIVDETNQLARYIMAELVGTGYQVREGWAFYEGTDPRSQKAWKHAVAIMEMITFTNADDALSNLEVEGLDPNSRFPIEDWKYEVANDDTRLGYEAWLEARCEE